MHLKQPYSITQKQKQAKNQKEVKNEVRNYVQSAKSLTDKKVRLLRDFGVIVTPSIRKQMYKKLEHSEVALENYCRLLILKNLEA